MNSNKEKFYDLIVIGGGTSGAAAAISAARNGIKTLLIEKNSYLGGAMTSQLVMPMMNNISFRKEDYKSSILAEILSELYVSGDGVVYKDGNPGWFNPEKMKFVLETCALRAGVSILYDNVVVDVIKEGEIIRGIKTFYKGITSEYMAKYFVDATGDANLAAMSGVKFENGEDGKNQFMSLRFEMGGVDIKQLANWMIEQKIDDDVSNVFCKNEREIYLSIGFSYGEKKSPYQAINKLIDKAIEDGIINEDDVNYIQFFSIPGKRGTLSFNSPRINSFLNPLSSEDTTKALIKGRAAIVRLEKFFRNYIPGFEKSFVSSVANELGIRDSRRICSEYILRKNDIEKGKIFDKNIFESDYPSDIHQKGKTISQERKQFGAPYECCLNREVKNLFVIGRCIGADFYAQSALRIQPNCFSMGEHIGNYIKNLLRNATL